MCEVDKMHFKVLNLGTRVLHKNQDRAEQNRTWFKSHAVHAINIMSSPGSGKTSLLEKTTQALRGIRQVSILVGDLQTELDADRLKKVGAKAKQINTGNGCHLDASMIAQQLDHFVTGHEDLLLIENVGNLVCPSSFDLGEKSKVVLLSVTEGEEKPLKYPVLFHQADVILITKVDLANYVPWNKARAIDAIFKINPRAKIIELSSLTGLGMDEWLHWLKEA